MKHKQQGSVCVKGADTVVKKEVIGKDLFERFDKDTLRGNKYHLIPHCASRKGTKKGKLCYAKKMCVLCH